MCQAKNANGYTAHDLSMRGGETGLRHGWNPGCHGELAGNWVKELRLVVVFLWHFFVK